MDIVGTAIGIAGVVVGGGFGLEQRRRNRETGATLSRLESLIRERSVRSDEAAQAIGETAKRDASRPRWKEALAEDIAQLPDDEKLVLTLRYYEALSIDEIAQVMGTSQDKVTGTLDQAHGRLRFGPFLEERE